LPETPSCSPRATNRPFPQLADAVKRGLIRTCLICDGYEAIGKRVAVLGAGEHAAAEALFLRTYSGQITFLLPADGAEALSDEKPDGR
jgi:thioredoxin reductase (NADPH)